MQCDSSTAGRQDDQIAINFLDMDRRADATIKKSRIQLRIPHRIGHTKNIKKKKKSNFLNPGRQSAPPLKQPIDTEIPILL